MTTTTNPCPTTHASKSAKRPPMRALVARVPSLLLAAGALSLAGAALAGWPAGAHPTLEEPAPALSSEPSQGEAPSPIAAPRPSSLSMDYEPGAEAGERRIAAAQSAAAKAGSAEAHAALALAFLQRKRETSDAAYLHYAQAALDAARAEDASATEVLVVTTLIAQDGHRFREALELSRQMVRRRPSDPLGHLMAGDALLELGDYADALDAYQTALDLRPDLRSYNRAAHLRWLHGDFDGAVQALELALDAGSPRDPEAMAWCYVDLGTMHLDRGDHARAMAAAERATRLVDGYAPAIILKARASAKAGEVDAAIAAYELATERLPHVEDLLALSELYATRDRRAEARDAFDKARRLAGGDPRPMAHHLARHGEDLDEALRLAEIELDARRNIAALDTYALVQIRRGALREAEGALNDAMALGSQSAELFLHRALWHLANGDAARAGDDLATAQELNPHVDPLLRAELATEVSR